MKLAAVTQVWYINNVQTHTCFKSRQGNLAHEKLLACQACAKLALSHYIYGPPYGKDF